MRSVTWILLLVLSAPATAMVSKIISTVQNIADTIVGTVESLIGRCPTSTRPKVLMISFDGFRHDYLKLYPDLTPNLKIFMQNVSRVNQLKPIFPSLTFPNHATLITGMYAESHGIVNNQFASCSNQTREFDYVADGRRTNDNEFFSPGVVPIWITNEIAGGTSSLVGWPFANDEWFLNGQKWTPTYGESFMKTLATATLCAQKVEKALSHFRNCDKPANLVLLYNNYMDEAAHIAGLDSLLLKSAVKMSDACVGYLMKRVKDYNLTDEVDIVLTSDHGMAAVNTTYITNDLVNVTSFKSWGYTVVHVCPDKGKETEVLNAFKEASNKRGGFDAYSKEEIPKRYNYKNHSNIPSVLLVAKLGFDLAPSAIPRYVGEHGYDNELLAMQTVLFATGPSIKKGVELGSVENVNVYPFVCHLLGITPQANNGSIDALRPLLVNTKKA